MHEDRVAYITLDGKEYPMLLTTKATKDITKKFGGLKELGEKLYSPDQFGDMMESYVWLIVLLSNQPILLHNLKNPNDKMELLSEEYVELITSPYSITDYNDAIIKVLQGGTTRNIQSEDAEPKNEQTG